MEWIIDVKKFNRYSVAVLICVLSLGLLVSQIYGVLVNPYQRYAQANGLQAPEDFYKELDDRYKVDGHSIKFIDFVSHRLGASVKYEWSIAEEMMPFQENWLLYALRIFDPLIAKFLLRDSEIKVFGHVELVNYEHALRRGYGVCSQLALAFSDLLQRRYHFDAHLAGLNGHVTVQIYGVDGVDIVFDPSYGVWAIGNVKQPQVLPTVFLEAVENTKGAYLSPDDNYISPVSGWGPYSSNSFYKQYALLWFVYLSYFLKWLIPIFGLLLSTRRLGLLGNVWKVNTR